MANNETAFRTELVKAFRPVAFTQVIAQRFSAGMPDLLVCWLGEAWFLELKFKPTALVDPLILLTNLQRSWMHRYQIAGGNAAWVVGVPSGPSEWRLYAGLDPRQVRATSFDLATTRRRGVPWDVGRLLDFLTNQRDVGPEARGERE